MGTICKGGSVIHPEHRDIDPIIVMNTCLLAGTIILQSGAETERVEDTMMRMAAACGIRTHSFVTPTAVIFSTDDAQFTKMSRVSNRSTDLHKVVQVNEVSRQLTAGSMSIQEAQAQLREIDKADSNYHPVLRILLASVTSVAFLLMFGGAWNSMLPPFVGGGLGYLIVHLIHRWINLKFFAELIGSFAIGVVASAFVDIGVGSKLSIIIVASVMPLVPGIVITNAVRDLMSGHLMSGISKGAEAFLTAFAIGAGIAVAIQFV